MKKEVSLAVVLGLIVGLIITIGVFRARRAVQETFPLSSGIPTQLSQATPSPSPASQSTEISLVTPEDESLVAEAAIRVSGKTYPNTTIIVLQEGKETIGNVDAQGNFSVPITLEAGGNILVIRVIKEDGTTSEVTRSIIVSSANLEDNQVASAAASPVATRSARATATPRATVRPTP